jgi:hypothetical protein
MRYQALSHRVIRPYAELLCRECNAFASVLQLFVSGAAAANSRLPRTTSLSAYRSEALGRRRVCSVKCVNPHRSNATHEKLLHTRRWLLPASWLQLPRGFADYRAISKGAFRKSRSPAARTFLHFQLLMWQGQTCVRSGFRRDTFYP